jgi:hypothetical protein
MRSVKSRKDAARVYLNYSNDGAYLTLTFAASLPPFDDSALDVLVEVSGGRPGKMLENAHILIEEAARDGCRAITSKEARDILAEAGPVNEEEKPVRRPRGIGLVS